MANHRPESIKLCIDSEIGKLDKVLLHSPGPEVENMLPENVQRALYSDILNLKLAAEEHAQFQKVIEKICTPLFVTDMLEQALSNGNIKDRLINRVCVTEKSLRIKDYLRNLDAHNLAHKLIEGVPLLQETFTDFLNRERFALQPVHNAFFVRDSAMVLFDQVLIGKMASPVRVRESIIMDAIFDHHPAFENEPITALDSFETEGAITIEGGDIQVLRNDIIVIGMGSRTSAFGIDFIVDRLKNIREKLNIIIQELPESPESFIHLDMIFTVLDHNKCLIFEPIILRHNKYQTVHIRIENGEIRSINTVENILSILSDLGMELEPLFCGGQKDTLHQEREQWHSGANCFALEPGKVVGYSRNLHTLEEFDKHGFEIIRANDFISGKKHINDYTRCIVTIDGSELSRGGGGARCMTMPISRKPV